MDNISVIGSGSMGSGIAHLFAANGYRVNLAARTEKSLINAIAIIGNHLDRQINKGVITEETKKNTLANIATYISLNAAVASADLVIETVPENLELKLNVFKQLDKICSAHTILATNTSSFPITQIASVTKRADKVIGIHFMNPALVLELVEVISGQATAPATREYVMKLVSKLGKVAVEVKDYPGFIASRLLAVLINEAVYSLYEGVAGAKEIDEVMKLGMAHPMGPLEVADFVGLDVVLNVMKLLFEQFKNPKYAPCALLVNMVAAGHLGIKSGKGFYEYRADSTKVDLGFNKEKWA